MTDGEALRRVIVANPDDDTPRLIYADWLDESGSDPDRAAFIRAQVEAARAEPFSPQQRAANKRADQLLARHKIGWARDLLTKTIDVRFARGFVEEVWVDPARFPAAAEQVFEAEPVRAVRVVRVLVEGDPAPREHTWLHPVFDIPRLRQLTRLDLRGVHLLPEEEAALARSPHLAGLRELCLRDNPLSPDWVADLLTGDRFPQLTALDVADIGHLGPALIRGLARTTRRLKKLDVSGVTSLHSEQMKVLLATPGLKEVEELRLGWPGQASPGPMPHLDLGWVLPWNRLRVLDLTGQMLGPEGAVEIDRKKEAANLRGLGLASNGLGRAGAWALAGAERLNPYYLDVRGNNLEPRDIRKLRDRFPDAEVVG